MLSDFFDAVRRPGSLRSSPLPEKVPFSLPEEYYKNKATELKQQLQSRMGTYHPYQRQQEYEGPKNHA